MRLRRADLTAPGYGRRRRGRGMSYLDTDGRPITDPEELDRLRGLAVPPAWRDVWISPHPRAHIQATGSSRRIGSAPRTLGVTSGAWAWVPAPRWVSVFAEAGRGRRSGAWQAG